MARASTENEVGDFGHAVSLFVRHIRAAAAGHQLSWTESAVLARLAKQGPSTTADLARAESMKPQSMGTTIATLEQMGLVQRKPHPTDGRQVFIELTAKGSAVRSSSRDAKHAWLEQVLAQLNNQERETLFTAGRIMKRLVEE